MFIEGGPSGRPFSLLGCCFLLSCAAMPAFHLGIVCGLVFGAAVVAMMLPMQFPNKRAALLGAFFNRFAIGVMIALMDRGRIGWAAGLITGLLLSLPEAIITKAYVPILVIGTAGGALIGWIVHRFGI